jgi:hypothetical protein
VLSVYAVAVPNFILAKGDTDTWQCHYAHEHSGRTDTPTWVTEQF